MKIEYLDEERLCNDFFPLIAELECGTHYDATNPQHVEWLLRRVHVYHLNGGIAIGLYSDVGVPAGCILFVHDAGLDGVRCFGKKAWIASFGLFSECRSKGLGGILLNEAESYARKRGAECLYVDTYAGNTGAVRYYVKMGFVPVAYHPGESGLKDLGQVYLYKELRS